jgi:hypothetical protein
MILADGFLFDDGGQLKEKVKTDEYDGMNKF